MSVEDRSRMEERLRGAAKQVEGAASQVEADVRRLITYVNDEVVPDVRRNGSQALRAAAAELHRLATRMEEAGKPAPPPPPPSRTGSSGR